MRGRQEKQATMLSFITPEHRIPQGHPIRRIKALVEQELKLLSLVFKQMYSTTGRPSIPPETILKSLLLVALFSVRSERQFCEQLDCNLFFRWFLGMDMIAESFDAAVFTKNRERLMDHEVGRLFFDAVVRQSMGGHPCIPDIISASVCGRGWKRSMAV